MLLNEEIKYVEVELNSNLIKYYKSLGYNIPKSLNSQKKSTTKKGTKIMVKEKDLLNKRLIGNTYGKLIVIDYDFKRSEESYSQKTYYRFWLCKCDCGNENLVSINQMNLLTGKSTSCGCMFKKNIEDLTGKVYGRLKVIKLDKERTKNDKKTFWMCECNCGSKDLISIESDSLKRGDTQSCGCIWKEAISGENSWNWKGGITELYQHLRNKIIPWTIDTFIKYDRKCIITNMKGEVIHHMIDFSDIVHESLIELNLPVYKNVSNYTNDEINNIDDLVVKKHYEYNCGVPLREDIHLLFHKTYGYKNNTIKQFLEFINKIYSNEIEIPYWTDNAKGEWKKLIDTKINEIQQLKNII